MVSVSPQTSGWVIAYCFVMLLISLNTTVLGYAAPELLFRNASLDFDSAAPVVDFYATRNLSVTVLFAVALLARARPLLLAAMLTRLVMDGVDLAFTVHHGIVAVSPAIVVPAWLAFFTLPQLACVWHLRDGGRGRSFHFQFEEHIQIQASRAHVWEKLADHQAMPSWILLGLKWVKLSADGPARPGEPGSLRTIRFVGWPPVQERLIEVSALDGYTYGVIAGMPQLRDHLGRVWIEDADGGLRLSWTITFDFHPHHPLSWTSPVFVWGFRKVVARGLSEFKRQVEAETS